MTASRYGASWSWTTPIWRFPPPGSARLGAAAPAVGNAGALGWAGVLQVVQAAGCAHQPRVTGGGKGSCETPGLTWVNTLLGNVKRAMYRTYHACETRYAGRYLAEFAYRFNRRCQLVDLVPRLAYVAVRTPPLPQRLLTLAGVAG